ncbi:MAG: TetR/AcrR family transcriptional regulator [Nocardioidaceae bacterium]
MSAATMPTSVLTRAERQAQTRARLVATARALFLRDGFSNTSLDRVAEEAGFSKGAVYSNFRNKDELCLAVLDDIHAEQLARIVDAFGSPHSFEERLAAFQRWAEERLGEPRWTSLEVEFATRARLSKYVSRELAQRNAAVRESLAGLIRESAQSYDLHLQMAPDDVATALLSLGIGLGVARANDPAVGVDVLTATIRILLGQTAGSTHA